MELHLTLIGLAGLVVLVMALLPRLLPRYPLSVPIVLLGIGLAAFSLPLGLPHVDPLEHGKWFEYVTEFTVIVALTGAGIKLDRRIGWRAWRSTWILLALTMPITIGLTMLVGWWAIGLAPASALLLAAAIAPTDPVLAGEVQVGPPGEGAAHEGRVGFALTSEAGLNDGLAFPFTHAAVAMATAGAAPDAWLGEWLLVDVLWRVAMGIAMGAGVGWLFGRLLFGDMHLSRYTDGLVAIAAALAAYTATELVEGYGFLAVFVAAYMIRDTERDHAEHRALHRFTEQVEHLALAATMLLLAGAVAGGILDALTPAAVAVAFAIVLLIRPLAGLPVCGSELETRRQGLAVAFFGIRGIGSLYYLAYATNHAHFEDAELLWATATLVVLISIVLHGTTSFLVERYVEPRSSGLRGRITTLVRGAK